MSMSSPTTAPRSDDGKLSVCILYSLILTDFLFRISHSTSCWRCDWRSTFYFTHCHHYHYYHYPCMVPKEKEIWKT